MDDPEIKANVDAINRSLMLEDMPMRKSSKETPEDKPTRKSSKETPDDKPPSRRGSKEAPEAKPVELTHKQVLKLQQELIQNYEHIYFQARLANALKKAGSKQSEDFRKDRREMVDPVLKGVLPKYG